MATSIAREPATESPGRLEAEPASRRSGRRHACDGPLRHPVRRRRLVRRLRSARPGTLVLISAPAGYGKTSLLRQWAEDDPRPFAWIALDRSHRSPNVLCADLLAEIGDTGLLPSPRGRRRVDDPVGVLRATLPHANGPFVIVLDGVQAAETSATLEMLSALLVILPPGGQLALASRTEPSLPLGRLAAEGGLLRLGMSDLALDDSEAGALMRAAGVEAQEGDVAAIVRRVEGWPAAVSLAAAACREEGGPGAIADFSGADRLAARYVRDELLAGLSEDTIEFLTRTSILERMSSGLCDAVLRRRGSGRRLQELERENLFLVALDRTEDWYRYHRVVRETLQSELRRREPALVALLHGRASAWLGEHGEHEEAVAHALAGGDLPRAGDVVAGRLATDHGSGRLATVRGWLGQLDGGQIASCAELALAAAWCEAEAGGELVEHWISAAECAPDPPGAHGPKSLATGIATLRGAMAAHGARSMAEYAAAAGRLDPASPWRAFACLYEGIAWHLLGDGVRARRLVVESGVRAGHLLPSVHVLGLGRLALLEWEAGDCERAATLVGRARAALDAHGLVDYLSMAPVYAVSALVLATADRTEEARSDILEARRLLERADAPPAWLAVETGVVLARAAILCADLLGARALLHEAERRLPGAGEAPTLAAALAAVRGQCRRPDASSSAAGELTAAELRILRYMPTHLSFPQVATRLHVSRFTVKSQALSIYRKLRVTSRSEAVERAGELGLLTPGD